MDKKEYNRLWHQRNKERLREYRRAYKKEWAKANRDKVNASKRRHYLTHKEQIREQNRRTRANHPDTVKAGLKRYSLKVKTEVLTHYSSGPLACVKCGFSDMRALTIDHIHGGGNKHRVLLNRNIYVWLRQNNYPAGYQTLCMNCQLVKRMENKEHG